MHLDALLILQRSDIAHHAKAGRAMADLPLIFLDPGLVDEAVKAGLDPARFSYRPLPVDPHGKSRAAQEAEWRAGRIDQLLSAEREALFGPGLYQGWDHGPMRQFFVRALVSLHLGEAAARHLPEAVIGLYRPNKPQLFYFDSFLSTDLFTQGRPRWRMGGDYDQVANWEPNHAAMVIDADLLATAVQKGDAEALTHIPTCYQLYGHYAAEITRRFTRSIDIPSVLWDVPVRRGHTLHRRIDSLPREQVSETALRYRERARQVFETELATLPLSRDAVRTQSAMLAERCFMQALNHEALLKGLQGSQPHLVVTDHDTGLNGPLYSVAARLDMPITVLPHASYPVFALPHARGVTAIERDGYQTPVRTILGEQVKVRPILAGPGLPNRPRAQLRTVCLLLNTLSGQGVAYIDFTGMVRFHEALAALCQAQGMRLLVRLKPNGAAPLIASSGFQVSADTLQAVLSVPIQELAEYSDLCVSYGEPTSASIEFLATGCHVLHTSQQHWPVNYWNAPAYIGDGTVGSFDDATALGHIARLLSDAAFFEREAAAQRLRYTSRLSATDGTIFSAS